MRSLSPYLPRIRQGFGVLVILSAWALYSGYDLVLQERFTEFCAQNGLSFLSSFQTNPICDRGARSPAGSASSLVRWHGTAHYAILDEQFAKRCL